MSEMKLERDRQFGQEAYIYRIHSLDGGLVTSISPRLLQQNQGLASDILNLDFVYPGIPVKRKGTEDTLDDASGDHINGLYKFDRTFTEDEYILLADGFSETGETSLEYWDAENETWADVMGISNTLPDEIPNFNTFADQVVIAFPSYGLFSWNGEEVKEGLGEEKAEVETFFIYENNDLRFIAKEAGKEGNYIRVAIEEPESETSEISITTEGTQEEEDPFIITVTPEWKDVTKHKVMIFLDSPTGGAWEIGDPFTMIEVAYDISSVELKSVLQDLYGDDEIESVEDGTEADEDFIITFATLVNSHLRTDFAGLEGVASPVSEEYQEYEDAEILSTSQEIKDAIEADTEANDKIDVEAIGDGTGKVYRFEESPLTGGYDAVKGAFLEDYRTRLLLAGDPDDPNKLRASHTGDPSLWDPTASGSNAFELYVGPDDGTHVTGILEMGDGGILIGKETSTYALFGYTRENMIVDLIDSRVGVVNHRSMGFVKPYGIFVSWDGIYRYESGQLPEKISLPIQSIFDNEVDHDKLDESSCVTDSRAYILSLPAKEGNSIVLVYYSDQDRWTRWDQPNGVFFTKVKDGFLFSKRDSLEIKKYGIEERTDDGQIFETKMTTIELDAELPERVKYYGELYVIFRTAGELYKVDVSVALDGRDLKEYAKSEIIEGKEDKQKVLMISLGKEARFLEVSIENNEMGKGFYPLSIIYTYRPHGVL